MVGRVSFSSYGFLAATAVWTLGWLAAAALAAERVKRAADAPAVVALGVALILGALGSWVTLRAARKNASEPKGPTPKEPWLDQIVGWLAAVVWFGVAVAWNVGVIGWLLRMAQEGNGWAMLFLLPWSLIGWFLMVVLFVGLGVAIDSLLGALWRSYR